MTVNVEREPLGRPEPWPAPAKLNLFLHVVGQRADGYHLLQTAFQFVDLCDELRFFRRPAGVVTRLGEIPGVSAEQDLVARAAKLLAARHPGAGGVAIDVSKKIPMQAGLGGGSSDAATVLVALNELWGLGLALDELANLGLSLGADVPVFVHGQAAWAEGIGEHLTSLELPEPLYVVLRPDAAVSTAEVFQAPDLTRDSPTIKIRDFLETGGRNDCEPVVRRRVPAVAEALDWLSRFGSARLTGTGSCVFAEMPDEEAAREVLGRLPGRWTGWVVRGLNRSPLVERRRLEQDHTGRGR